MSACNICGNSSGNKTHVAREMLFGLRDKFEYLECGNCGCLILMNVPTDMAKYYPPNYYSFQTHGWLLTRVRRRWAAYASGKKSLVGWFVTQLICVHNPIISVHRLNPSKDARILDVGCGSGKLLQDLYYLGYSNTSGADLFIEKDIIYPNGLTIYKRQLVEISGSYDIVMLHHAFEHMDQPAEVLRMIARLLAKDGRVIIRIPVASSYGWKHYGINWVCLDAPRHLFLHTFKSMKILCGQSGLEITDTIHEAEEMNITASESYLKDIPLTDPRYPLSSYVKRFLTLNRRKADKRRAQEINERKEADTVCLYLKKQP
jgi:SAM-dependent methyltransferase